jgi:hypothetical protein
MQSGQVELAERTSVERLPVYSGQQKWQECEVLALHTPAGIQQLCLRTNPIRRQRGGRNQ